jgi:N,N'-diacetylchitobiose transport system permease protein
VSKPGVETERLAPKKNFHFPLAKVLLSILAVAIAVIWLFPVYWMVSSSLLPNSVLSSVTPRFFPTGGSLDNFAAVLTDGGGERWWAFWDPEQSSDFMLALWVSLRVTLLSLFVVLLFAFLAALAISRYKFRGRKGFVLAILFIQMLPAEGLFIAEYKMLSSIGIATDGVIGLNSVLGLSILYIAAVIPFTVWMLRGFIAGVPAELEESAKVDGCSSTGAFVRITFPLLAPGLVASGVYAFLQCWNEFTRALVIMDTHASHTLPLWLRGFIQASQTREIDWGQVMAASTLVAIPVIIFFLLVQGRMTSGLVAGAVKG